MSHSRLITPSAESRRTNLPPLKPLRKGLEAWLHGLYGAWLRRSARVRFWLQEAERILDQQKQFQLLSESKLHHYLGELRLRGMRGGWAAPDFRRQCFAAIVENALRTTGLQAYPEQICATLGLTHGALMEMATGEGKTLTLGLATVLAAWKGLPVHVVTANDYLAERDADWLQKHYRGCGVEVGYVTSPMDPAARQRQYRHAIVYTTAKELLADFLRDRLQLGELSDAARRQLRFLLQPRLQQSLPTVQNGLYSVFVDEADYVLIDEAVTPLIISRAKENRMLQEATKAAFQLASRLQPEVDYRGVAKYQEIILRSSAEKWIAEVSITQPVLQNRQWRKEMVEQVLRAKEFYHRDKHYIIDDGKVVIVDEGTGRPMPGRSWRLGLHQAIECKEGLPMSDPAETLGGISFQRFFRLIPHLAGVTGTAWENRAELWRIYRLPVLRVPTHKPCVRKYQPAQVLPDTQSKWQAVQECIRQIHHYGAPILVGTRSVRASEELAALLRQEGLHFQLLNAVNHMHEAAIVADAGKYASLTIATNMAGRGTDIKPEPAALGLGGLHVIATEFHESSRVDRQLYGRCARQGDPGTVFQFASLDDEVISKHTPAWLRKWLCWALRHKLFGAQTVSYWACRQAQRAATRQNFKSRLLLLAQDKWMSEQLSFGSGPRGI